MKTKLIALVALAIADFAFLAADVAADAEFEVEADHAEGLLTAGKAKLADAPPAAKKTGKTVKARVLMSGIYGQPNDVADVDADEVKAAEASGQIDASKAAVAYAEKMAKESQA
jgi:hypothetical protein